MRKIILWRVDYIAGDGREHHVMVAASTIETASSMARSYGTDFYGNAPSITGVRREGEVLVP